MKKIKSNILIYGTLSSGSSAVFDLLLEYDNINAIPGEFDDFRAPGLVADQLSYHQRIDFPNKINELTKFKSIVNLAYGVFPVFNWRLHTITGIKSRLFYFMIRIKQINLLKKLNQKLKSNISFEYKIHYTNNWISDIGKINIKDKEFILYNQPIEIGNDDNIWQLAFNPYKLICVYRDPKDQLADIIKRGLLYDSFVGPYMTIAGANIEAIYGRDRKGAINFHIDAIKKRMEWLDTLKKELDPDKFLLIDFEGLVNNYDTYKSVIENFIGDLKNNHTHKKKFFNPAISLKNIGIYKNHISQSELDLLTELDASYNNTIKNNQIKIEIK